MSKTEEITPPVAARDAAGPPQIDERYRIEKEIGRGGMGRVFVAHDRKLGRDVAIKVLASGMHGEEALRRFEQEARATCALNHANILDVHDIGMYEGSPYIVSELLHGSTLRERLRSGPLTVQEASGYALQLAQGLSAAHEKGIVHRDLKPENLFITEEGRLKILDFGIAKLVAPMTLGTGETLPSPQPHTEDGAILGTVGYMSPEQVRGQPADRRSDVFSFGAIFYELLAGRSPFERDTAVETGYAILNDDPLPLPLGVPAALDRLIRRCLAKRPEDRFQSARELVEGLAATGVERAPAQRRVYRWALGVGAALILVVLAVLGWRLRARGEGPGNSIAVLPFVNLSSDRENEYFSDGITEEILNALAQVDGLRVIGRTSSFSFKGKNEDLRSIGEKLDVAYLLEGSVRKEGNSVRVAAQLIESAHGSHLWSQTYDRELKNVFSVEDELARAIVQALKAKLVPGAALVRQTTASTEAHDLYLKGRFFLNQRNKEGLAKATALLEQAIALDPRYALAHSGLADAYAFSAFYGGARWAEALAKAATHALRAVELDDGLAEAHTSLGLVKIEEYDWGGAERELKRAIELRPGNVNAHNWYSIVLSSLGRLPEARAELELARQLEPTSFVIFTNIASDFFENHEWGRAIEQSRKAIELNPGFARPRICLVESFLRAGQFAEAQVALDAATAAVGPLEPLRAEVLAISGQRAEARRLLASLEQRSGAEKFRSTEIAAAYVALGDKDSAFAWIGKGLEERETRLYDLKVNPLWDPIRPDPRFHALLRRMNLE